MKDYRLPRKSKSRAIKIARPAVRSPRRRTVAPSANSGFLSSVMKIGMWLAGIFLVAGLSVYAVLTIVLPHFFPLDRHTNIVFVSSEKDLNRNQIVLAQFRYDPPSLILVNITNDETVSVIGGFGQYPLRSVYPLLVQENKGFPFARGAFSFITGEVVDGIVAVPSDQLPMTRDQIADSLRPGQAITSSLSMRDRVTLWLFAQQVPGQNVSYKTMSSLSDWTAYRSKLALQFPEDECSVAVVNTTNKGGLATEISGIIEQTGYTVLRITDAATNQPNTSIAYDDSQPACAQQAQRLGDLFPAPVTITPDANQAQTYRAKIVISLGQDVSSLR